MTVSEGLRVDPESNFGKRVIDCFTNMKVLKTPYGKFWVSAVKCLPEEKVIEAQFRRAE